MKMCIQLDSYAVLHPVIQNRRLAGPTNEKDILEKGKFSCSRRRSNPGIVQPQEHLINVKISFFCHVVMSVSSDVSFSELNRICSSV